MRVESGAGDFEMTVFRVETRGRNLVLKGNMGVWISDTVMEPREIFHLLRLHMRPSVLWYILRLPWTALWNR